MGLSLIFIFLNETKALKKSRVVTNKKKRILFLIITIEISMLYSTKYLNSLNICEYCTKSVYDIFLISKWFSLPRISGIILRYPVVSTVIEQKWLPRMAFGHRHSEKSKIFRCICQCFSPWYLFLDVEDGWVF